MNDSSEPLVSVVVPAHNAETTIRETIDSVLCQTFGNFELLIIDDGSTDATVEIVTSVLDSRVRCFSFSNAGPSAARNRGIAEASGKFIAFLDADDLWLPNKLAAQVDALQSSPEAALAFSWSDIIDETGAFVKKGNYVHLKEPVYEQLIEWNFLDSGSNPMIRSEVLSEVGVFDEGIWLPEDWDLYLRIAYRYPIICIPEVHVLYRVQRNSASSSNVNLMAEASLKVLRRALDRLPPSRHRDWLERTSKANLYQHLAMRVVETSTGRRSGFEAARYWWKYVCTTPNLLANSKRAAFIACAISAIIILPPGLYRNLRRGWSRIQGSKDKG